MDKWGDERIYVRVVDFLYRGVHSRDEFIYTAPGNWGGVVGRLLFRASPVVAGISPVACRFVEDTDFFVVCRDVRVFFRGTDAGHGFFALLFAAHVGTG